MRLAVISDIHGNLNALKAVFEDLEQQDADIVWCLGDLAFGGTRPSECIALLQTQQAKYGDSRFKIIGGNTDRYIVTGQRPQLNPIQASQELETFKHHLRRRDDMLSWTLDQLDWEQYTFLAAILHRELQLSVEAYGHVIGYHAIPGDDDTIKLAPDTPDEEAIDALLDRSGRLAIGGHTHLVMDRVLGHWRAINPGSVGLSFTDFRHAEWALIDFSGEEAHLDLRRVAYNFQDSLDDIARVQYPHPDWLQRFIQS